jgi:hypothetical protein
VVAVALAAVALPKLLEPPEPEPLAADIGVLGVGATGVEGAQDDFEGRERGEDEAPRERGSGAGDPGERPKQREPDRSNSSSELHKPDGRERRDSRGDRDRPDPSKAAPAPPPAPSTPAPAPAPAPAPVPVTPPSPTPPPPPEFGP